jgi:hypothetical protein
MRTLSWRLTFCTALLSLAILGLPTPLQAVSFQKKTVAAGFGPNAVVAGDFNNDGIMDLAIADGCYDITCIGSGAVTVLLGNGNGTFQPPLESVASSGGQGPIFIAAGDFNHDGILDLVTANIGINVYGGLSVLLGNGDGTFQGPLEFSVVGTTPVFVEVGDFNGDGIMDVVALNYQTAGVTLFLGNGDGTLQAGINYPVGQNPISAAVVDLNGDGRTDLAVDCQIPDSLTVFLNTSHR